MGEGWSVVAETQEFAMIGVGREGLKFVQHPYSVQGTMVPTALNRAALSWAHRSP